MADDDDSQYFKNYVPYQYRSEFMHYVRKNDTIKAIDFINDQKVSQNEIHTGIRYAIKCENMEMLSTLIDYIIDPDSDSGYPIPILHLPIYYENLPMLQFLLESGLNANVRDRQGYTALMIAAKYGLFDFVKVLLASGADPDIEREGPMTALSLAASNEQFAIVHYLIGD
nr:ankyrin repeat protein [Hymenolepis microstoma]